MRMRPGTIGRITRCVSACSQKSAQFWRAMPVHSPGVPHIAHCNDWQSGLVPAYLHFHQGKKAASLMTIHNLAFQGIFPADTITQLGLPAASFDINGAEYYGGMSFLKAGLYYSDHIATVSPTYAREIQTAPLGFGMQGLLSARRSISAASSTASILTIGIPPPIPISCTELHANKLAAKAANKRALQQLLGLAVDPGIPLFGAVSRLTYQKGYDLLLAGSGAINRNAGATGYSG